MSIVDVRQSWGEGVNYPPVRRRKREPAVKGYRSASDRLTSALGGLSIATFAGYWIYSGVVIPLRTGIRRKSPSIEDYPEWFWIETVIAGALGLLLALFGLWIAIDGQSIPVPRRRKRSRREI